MAAEGQQEERQTVSPELTSVWRGYRLHVQTWLPQDEPRGMLYLSHGVREHMGRYEKLGEFLAENGIILFGHDHVGHGQSEGDQVHVETLDTYIQDVIHHVEEMKREHPDLPCLLMGHSMGGLVALHVARLRPDLFTGLISSGAATHIDTSAILKVVARAIAFLMPQAGIANIDSNQISSVEEEVRMYDEDPLVYHGKLKAKWAVAMVDSVNVIREEIATIRLPILIIHGSDDPLVSITSSQFIMDNVSSGDKTFERFEGCRHEILHDVGQERARELIKDWVLAHLNQPAQPETPLPEPQALEQESAPGQEPESTGQEPESTGQEPESTGQESESTVTQEPEPEQSEPQEELSLEDL